MGFHKSLIYCPTSDDGPLHVPYHAAANSRSIKVDESLVYGTCLNQFRELTNAFRNRMSTGMIIIRNYCGDALELCDIIADCRIHKHSFGDVDNARDSDADYSADEGGNSSSSSRAATDTDADKFRRCQIAPGSSLVGLTLAPDAPRLFDMIDTSNICDSRGLLNILCACHSVLDPSVGVLVTEAFSAIVPEGGMKTACLTQQLKMDVTTFCTLTNLSLVDSSSMHTVNSGEFYNLRTANALGQEKSSVRFEWKYSHHDIGIARVSMTNEEFVQIFFQLFVAIFTQILGSLNPTPAEVKAVASAQQTVRCVTLEFSLLHVILTVELEFTNVYIQKCLPVMFGL